jgi:hypothetical protein
VEATSCVAADDNDVFILKVGALVEVEEVVVVVVAVVVI